QDVTERKRAEEAARASREKLTDAIEAMSDGFALFDAEDRYILTNSSYAKSFSRLADVVVPGTPYEITVKTAVERGRIDMHGDDPETWGAKMIEAHRACGEPREVELADGLWMRMVDRRTRDGGIVAIRTDITARKNAEEAVKAIQ